MDPALLSYIMSRQCEGKTGYPNKGQAKAALSRSLRRGETEFPELLDYYRCPHCREYHLGHNRRRAAFKKKGKRNGKRFRGARADRGEAGVLVHEVPAEVA